MCFIIHPSVFLGTKPSYYIADMDLCKEIFVKHFDKFVDRIVSSSVPKHFDKWQVTFARTGALFIDAIGPLHGELCILPCRHEHTIV